MPSLSRMSSRSRRSARDWCRCLSALLAAALMASGLTAMTLVPAAHAAKPIPSRPGASRSSSTSGSRRTLAHAPAGLRAAARASLRAPRQLEARYQSRATRLVAGHASLSVGRARINRAGAAPVMPSHLTHATWGAKYTASGVTESFRTVSEGIEQSFLLRSRPSGTGSVAISIPVSGLRATSGGTAIELRDAKGSVRATYSGLRVVDAAGHSVPADMHAAVVSHGVV